MPIDEEPTPVMLIATCHTDGCKIEDVSITAAYYANAAPPVYRGVCGPCGQTITDLVPALCDQCGAPVSSHPPTACGQCGHTVTDPARGEWPPEGPDGDPGAGATSDA
ncbi:hypothetical protein [Streptomyces sp. GDS52]|uniref:hypothetical protein n=1 Tax=Streptomyces sp. GDS52 TaxID=3406419 RepID=UPI003FCF75B8